MVQITNHIQRAISLLAAQFQETKADDSPTNLQKLLQALVASAQDIEDVNWELYSERWLTTAIGAQLDGIGQILGLPRNLGESDESYRERLLFQSFINRSTGTPEEIIFVLSTLTQATQVNYYELYPAAFQLYTNGSVFPNPPSDLVEVIKQISPAGVNYAPIIFNFGVAIPSIFGSEPVNVLLGVTPPGDPDILVPLEVTKDNVEFFNLEVNANQIPVTATEGFLAEGFPFDQVHTYGAGQTAEVVYLNSHLPPPG